MKKVFLSAVAIAVFGLYPASEVMAQENQDKEKSKNKLGEYDEIVIRQKDADKNGKVTIVVEDGAVTVNGKPLDEFDDESLSVRRRSATRYRMATPASPFRNGTTVWSRDGEDRPVLGVTTKITDEGVTITSVSENSGAAKAGLKEDDVITRVGDVEIDSPDELTRTIIKNKPEDKIVITYKRDGKENKTTATLGKREMTAFGAGGNVYVPAVPEMPHFEFESGPNGHTFFSTGRPRLGIRAQDTEDGKGVKVLSVDKGSVAEKAGIKEDDIITEFDGETINNTSELVSASRDARDKTSLNVKLSRNGQTQSMEIKIPKKLKTANL